MYNQIELEARAREMRAEYVARLFSNFAKKLRMRKSALPKGTLAA